MKVVFGVGTTAATSIPAEWADRLRARCHDVHVLASHAGSRRFARLLWAAIREIDPEVIHLHHTVPALSGLFLRGYRRRRYRVVLTVHRLMTDMEPLTRVAHMSGGRCADVVVANSHATLASFPQWLRRKSHVIYNGVDCSRLDAANPGGRLSAPGDRMRIVSVGRLIPEKGFDILLRAIAYLRLYRDLAVDLTIVGGGPARASLERLADLLEIRDSVAFTGAIERDGVYARLWAADIFVLCSRTEGFCNAVVEAMAADLPVVVTPAGALPEVVGAQGVVATGLSATAVADAIYSAATVDPRTRRMLGRSAADRARTSFSIERTLGQYEILYRQLAKQHAIQVSSATCAKPGPLSRSRLV